MDARCYQLFTNANEMRRHWRIDHRQNADILKTDRISCQVDGCYKNYNINYQQATEYFLAIYKRNIPVPD
ncbi:hypothetical protein ACTXT7_004536 [Hymenolepis weldensis]